LGGRFSLQWSKKDRRVPLYDEIDEAIAEIANAVEKDDLRVFG
jgi:cob(I)alamin adenosyltransferase